MSEINEHRMGSGSGRGRGMGAGHRQGARNVLTANHLHNLSG